MSRDESDVATTPRARKRKLLAHPSHEFGLWRREVSWESGLSHESQQSPVASPPAASPPAAASRRLPAFAFVMGRDGGPELVIRGEHPWLVSNRQAMPVLPRRRHEVSEPVEERHDTVAMRLAVNDDVPDSLFELSFPPGTVVFDEVRDVFYTVGDNGKELDGVVEVARQTLDAKRPGHPNSWLMVNIAAVAVIVATLVLRFARRQRRM